MKAAIIWFVLNFSVLGMFVCGHIYPNKTLIDVSVVLFWVVGVTGIIALFTQEETIISVTKESKPSVPKALDVGYDILVVVCLSFFGYFWLSLVYFFHIFGGLRIDKYRKNEKK